MAKKTKDKPNVHKPGAKRGGGSIEEQIARLEAGMTKAQITEAQALVDDPGRHDVVRLSFKKLPKASTRAITLSKREMEVYQQIVKAAGQPAADKWRAFRLEEKVKHLK